MMSDEDNNLNFNRDADDSDSSSQVSESDSVAKESKHGLASKMFSYANFSLFFGVIFTILVALQSSNPKISKPPPARPFFNKSSVVTDFYEGHLSALVDRIISLDFSFIMYYAPWDAESQTLRTEFEIVAQYYQSKVFFAAINCWHPGSECRNQHNKIPSYPVFMLYLSKHTGIQYSGIRTAPYMIKFLHAVMNPIVRITDRIQLINLFLEHDAVVLGFFNFSGVSKCPGYKEFHQSAIRSLEHDPNREITYALITDSRTSKSNYSVTQFPFAKLIMWNESMDYPEIDWTTENILNWIDTELHRVTLWLQPPGSKSLTFAPYFLDGPVLFLFTPRNPYHVTNHNYNLLKEVALKYYNCADNLPAEELVKALREKRHKAVSSYERMREHCTQIFSNLKPENNITAVNISIQKWINDTCFTQVVMNKCSTCEQKTTFPGPAICGIPSEVNQVCDKREIFGFPSKFNHNDHNLFCNHNVDDELLSENDEKIDEFSADYVRQSFHQEECKRFFTSDEYHRPVFPSNDDMELRVNLTSTICKINKTLSFIAIDSLHYFHFAEVLGIDILKREDKTAVVILDPLQESQYILRDDYNTNTLIEFINNYTRGNLRRTLRSEESKKSLHSFRANRNHECSGDTKICVPELTTDNFLETVMDSRKDTVVMYHSPYCAFCSAISYVYLTVAHYLSKMDHLMFVRIDGDNNDLPWEYTMDHYPSILFFPARRKEDSTVFPFSLPITVANLLNFILANLEGDAHIEALINICQIGVGEPPKDCVARIRSLCLNVIEEFLEEYRRLRRHESFLGNKIVSVRRRKILRKLKTMRSIHLLLETSIDLTREKHIVDLIRQKFKIYYKSILSI